MSIKKEDQNAGTLRSGSLPGEVLSDDDLQGITGGRKMLDADPSGNEDTGENTQPDVAGTVNGIKVGQACPCCGHDCWSVGDEPVSGIGHWNVFCQVCSELHGETVTINVPSRIYPRTCVTL